MVPRKQIKHDLRMLRKLRSYDSKHVQSRKVYKALLKQKKYNYSENKITSIFINIHDQIKFWKAIKSIIGGGNPNQINCIEIKEFFKHFSKMFNFVKPKSSICNELLYMYSDDILCVDFNMQITLEEIRDRLLELKTKKVARPDEVSNEMLKNAIPHIESFYKSYFIFCLLMVNFL